ncbi:MAG: hypothetical protein HXX14_00790 [Bacteroidetes bacterium]|nr:hypothetical protein [Bacteroidota bacterium]
MEKIPVHVISGFLGSGKTTAIINLLNQKTDNTEWAVIINEFGKISIDGQTVCSNSRFENVFTISGGCICCSAKEYFRDDLEKIVRTKRFTRIIIEPSGLGGVEMISEVVENHPTLFFKPVICLVDITGIENPRQQMNPVYRKQISKADVILFTKRDLIPDSTIQQNLIKKFKYLFPDTNVNDNNRTSDLLDLDYLHGEVNNENVTFSVDNPELWDSNYIEKSWSFHPNTIFNKVKLTRLFDDNLLIIRAKGYVHTGDGWNLLNLTLTGFTLDPCHPKEQNEIIIILAKNKSDFIQIFAAEVKKTIVVSKI